MNHKFDFDEAGVISFCWENNDIKLELELGSAHVADNQLDYSIIEITIENIKTFKCEEMKIVRNKSKSIESLMEGEDGTILGYNVAATDLSFCVDWTKYSPKKRFCKYYEIIGEKITYKFR